MEAAVIIKGGIKQVVLTPESKQEKLILDLFKDTQHPKVVIQCVDVGVGIVATKGEYLRGDRDNQSITLSIFEEDED